MILPRASASPPGWSWTLLASTVYALTAAPRFGGSMLSEASIDDARDWHKWFKCTDIDPTALPSAVVNRLRAKGYASLFARRILRRPFRTWKLLRTFSRHMKVSDILRLLCSPFRRRTLTRQTELPASMTDAAELESFSAGAAEARSV